MYRLWEQGYEVVEGVKSSRGKESGRHAFAAKLFYGMISSASGFDMENASDFKLLDRKAIDALVSLKEKYAFFRALSSWVGFKTTTVSYDVQERTAGESKWTTWGLMRYAVSNIASFTTAPMQIVTILGVITTVILMQGFIGSIIMMSLGMIGFYLARIYEEIKGRPRYIISKRAGRAAEPEVMRRC